jgi:hypothetical protein
VNISEFHEDILKGNANPTVAPSVRSNLTAVLGRGAGCKEEMTWNTLKQNRKLQPNLGIEGVTNLLITCKLLLHMQQKFARLVRVALAPRSCGQGAMNLHTGVDSVSARTVT